MPSHWPHFDQRMLAQAGRYRRFVLSNPLLGLLCVFISLSCGFFFLQDVAAQGTTDAKSLASDKPTGATLTAPPVKSGVQPSVDDVIDLLGADGQLRRIPRWANFEVFEKWLKSREKGIGPIAPPYSFSST